MQRFKFCTLYLCEWTVEKKWSTVSTFYKDTVDILPLGKSDRFARSSKCILYLQMCTYEVTIQWN